MITAIYASLATFFAIFLTFEVIKVRRNEKISVGHKDNPLMERTIRVHANFIETAPLAILLLLILELQNANNILLHAFGVSLIVVRVLHFLGLRSSEAPGKLRLFGMAGTLLVLTGLAALNLLFGLHII